MVARNFGVMTPQWSRAAQELIKWTNEQVSVNIVLRVKQGQITKSTDGGHQ